MDIQGKTVVAEKEPSVCFGPFRLAGSAGPLFREGIEVPLRHKAVKILWILAKHSGEARSKEQLIDAVWPNSIVSESSLSVCIREIREALGDDPRTPRYVQTMHRHGYRFVGRIGKDSQISRHVHLVGRHAELERLGQEFEFVQTGVPRLVLVNGDAGHGKSSLIETWCASAEESTNTRVIVGQCFDHSSDTEAYLPFLDALQRMINDVDGQNFVAQLRRFAPSWLSQFPSLLSPDERNTLSAVGIDAARMRRELADLLFALSADRPLVLVLEDMHWCDMSSAAALAFVARDRGYGRLLVIASYRDNEKVKSHHGLSKICRELNARNLCTEIKLQPLADIDVKRFLDGRFTQPVGDDVATAFNRRVEGHPLFMAALADQLTKHSVLTLSSIHEEHLPSGLVTFIELRLAEQDPVSRQLLETASVAGIRFSSAEIVGLIDGAEDQASIERLCETLCIRGGFLEELNIKTWPDGTLTGCYSFRHALFTDVIKGTIANVRRARMHQSIGETLERGFQAETSEIALLLAQHFSQAHDIPRAVNYLIEAASRCASRQAHAEAVELLRRGLSLVDILEEEAFSAPLELSLLLALGPVQVAMEGYGASAVESTFTKARLLCASNALADQRFAVLRGLAGFHQLRADYDTAHELGRELIAHGAQSDLSNDDYLVEGHMICGVVDFFCGRVSTAHCEFLKSTAVYDQSRHEAHAQMHGIDPGVLALGFDAITTWLLGQSGKAVERAESALKLAESVNHPFSLCQTFALLALLHQFRNDTQLTRHHSELASELAQQNGFPYILASEQARRGWLSVQAGDAISGVGDIQDGIKLYRDTGAIGGLTVIMSTLAEAHLVMGDIDLGLEVADDALRLARENGEGVCEAELLRLKGELILSGGDSDSPQQAGQLMSNARSLAHECQNKPQEIRATVGLAGLYFNQDRQEESAQLLTAVRDIDCEFLPKNLLLAYKSLKMSAV